MNYNLIGFVFADDTYKNDTPEHILVSKNWFWNSSTSIWNQKIGAMTVTDSGSSADSSASWDNRERQRPVLID